MSIRKVGNEENENKAERRKRKLSRKVLYRGRIVADRKEDVTVISSVYYTNCAVTCTVWVQGVHSEESLMISDIVNALLSHVTEIVMRLAMSTNN